MNLHWPVATEPIELADGDVHVWAVSVQQANSARRDPLSVLSSDERQRAARFALDEPRQRFIISRGALRTVLGQYLAMAPVDVPIVDGPNGKPLLAVSATTRDVHFNLAHSGQLALIAVATGCAVGVDVERLRPVHSMDEIVRRHFAASEISEILSAGEAERTTAFFECWTRKEALLKAIGAGLGFPLERFAVPLGLCEGAWVDLPAHGNYPAARCWLQHLDPCAGYVSAIATLGPPRRLVGLTYNM